MIQAQTRTGVSFVDNLTVPLREVVKRLSKAIDQLGARFEGLGEKLDSFVKELISHRAGGG